ncbi:hypothetical protein GCM10009740_16680 [Terrabacter terrae]|uniref:Uncharacterized protein n=1 Tax=Terrabacter terrae TaxID=318434 RepID=A0ABN2U271_9MICO
MLGPVIGGVVMAGGFVGVRGLSVRYPAATATSTKAHSNDTTVSLVRVTMPPHVNVSSAKAKVPQDAQLRAVRGMSGNPGLKHWACAKPA